MPPNGCKNVIRGFGILKLDGDQWVLDEIEPHVAIRLKNMFPKIPKYSVSPFTMANEEDVCADLVWFTQRYPLYMSKKDSNALRRMHRSYNKRRSAMEDILSASYVPDSSRYHLKPGQSTRDYQCQAVEMWKKTKGLMLADEYGLGKTYSAIGALTDKQMLPAAVVVQTHMQAQWAEKITEFSHLKYHLINSTKPYDLPPADIYIFRYSQLAGWVDFFTTKFFTSVVYDEIQDLRTGRSTAKGSGASVLSDNAEYRLGLSDTPMYNYGIEMFNIIEFLARGKLGTMEEFAREWCTGSENKVIKDPDALGSYLRENYIMLRRTRKDLGINHGDNVLTVVREVDYDEEAVKSAEALAISLAIKVTSGSFTERGQAARELDMHVRMMTGVSKARFVAQNVRMLVESGEPVILAGWHREVYDIWNEELKDLNPVMFTGSESVAQKEKAKQAFINGDTDLMFISLRSGVGVDGLQKRGAIMAYGELDWSPGVHRQLLGRLDREGGFDSVMAIYFASLAGSDPLMLDLLGVKKSQSQAIMDPGVLTVQKNGDKRMQMLAQQYLDKQHKGDRHGT